MFPSCQTFNNILLANNLICLLRCLHLSWSLCCVDQWKHPSLSSRGSSDGRFMNRVSGQTTFELHILQHEWHEHSWFPANCMQAAEVAFTWGSVGDNTAQDNSCMFSFAKAERAHILTCTILMTWGSYLAACVALRTKHVWWWKNNTKTSYRGAAWTTVDKGKTCIILAARLVTSTPTAIIGFKFGIPKTSQPILDITVYESVALLSAVKRYADFLGDGGQVLAEYVHP